MRRLLPFLAIVSRVTGFTYVLRKHPNTFHHRILPNASPPRKTLGRSPLFDPVVSVFASENGDFSEQPTGQLNHTLLTDDPYDTPGDPKFAFTRLTTLSEFSFIVYGVAQELSESLEGGSIVVDDLVDAGITLRLLMSCMERHASNAATVAQVLLLLWNILEREKPLYKPDGAFKADESGISTLISVLSQHQDDSDIVQLSWCVFAHLGMKEIKRRPQWHTFQDNATTDLLLDCMRVLPDIQGFMLTGVHSLLILVVVHEGNAALIVERGGLDVIVTAMNRYPQDLDLKSRACNLLTMVVNQYKEPVPIQFLESGAVAAVLVAMSQLRQNGDPSPLNTLASCCQFLAQVAGEERIQDEIVARNGVVEIVAAMNSQPDVGGVISVGGIDFFCQIAASGRHDDVLLNDGALGATVVAMERLQWNPAILAYSCSMIHCLSDPQRGRGEILVKGGAVEALVSVFRAADIFQDPYSVRLSLKALLNVVSSGTSLTAQQDLSVWKVCDVALDSFAQDAEMGPTIASIVKHLLQFQREKFNRLVEE